MILYRRPPPEQVLQQVAQCHDRMSQRHTRAGVSHDLNHLSAHVGAITMHGTAAAGRFPFAEAAAFEPAGGISGRLGAVRAKRTITLLAAAIEGNHGFYGLYFLFVGSAHVFHTDAGSDGTDGILYSSTSMTFLTFPTTPTERAAPRNMASLRSMVCRRNFPPMRVSLVCVELSASLSVIQFSAR